MSFITEMRDKALTELQTFIDYSKANDWVGPTIAGITGAFPVVVQGFGALGYYGYESYFCAKAGEEQYLIERMPTHGRYGFLDLRSEPEMMREHCFNTLTYKLNDDGTFNFKEKTDFIKSSGENSWFTKQVMDSCMKFLENLNVGYDDACVIPNFKAQYYEEAKGMTDEELKALLENKDIWHLFKDAEKKVKDTIADAEKLINDGKSAVNNATALFNNSTTQA